MRAFVTGASGFVGGWLCKHLESMGDEVGMLGHDVDVCDKEALAVAFGAFSPEVLYHLAALTQVAQSWGDPRETYRVNVLGTLEVLEAARNLAAPPRVVLISSSEVYGAGSGHALDEDAELAPLSPYASSKVGAEFLGVQAHLGRDMHVVRARPFNHVGPGQSDAFVVSGLARRIVAAELSGEKEIVVGNLSAARDFTDVRDVVRAYRLLAEHGIAGEVYNVCSGRSVTISEILDQLVAISDMSIVARVDPALFRPVDIPDLVGDCSKLHALTGWSPQVALEVTLREVLADWRNKLASP